VVRELGWGVGAGCVGCVVGEQAETAQLLLITETKFYTASEYFTLCCLSVVGWSFSSNYLSVMNYLNRLT